MRIFRRYDIDSPENRDPRALELFAKLVEGLLKPYFRYELIGVDRIPRGAALYVANHSGGMMPVDAFLFGVEVFRRRGLEDLPYGLGHDLAISLPLLHQLLVPLGAVRAHPETAHALLSRGRKALVYPGGDIDAFRPYRRRDRVDFGGRDGYIRLALRERIPIVPVVTAGAHETFFVLDDFRWLPGWLGLDRLLRLKVWPLSLSIPWGLVLGPTPPHLPLPSKILAEVLEPIELGHPELADDAGFIRACAAEVEGRMQHALTRLAERRRRGV